MPRRGSFINRNDSMDSTTACSLGNQSLGNAAMLAGGASNFLGVPKSDSPGLLAVPSGHCGKILQAYLILLHTNYLCSFFVSHKVFWFSSYGFAWEVGGVRIRLLHLIQTKTNLDWYTLSEPYLFWKYYWTWHNTSNRNRCLNYSSKLQLSKDIARKEKRTFCGTIDHTHAGLIWLFTDSLISSDTHYGILVVFYWEPSSRFLFITSNDHHPSHNGIIVPAIVLHAPTMRVTDVELINSVISCYKWNIWLILVAELDARPMPSKLLDYGFQ